MKTCLFLGAAHLAAGAVLALGQPFDATISTAMVYSQLGGGALLLALALALKLTKN